MTDNSENLIIHITRKIEFLHSILSSSSIKLFFSSEEFTFNGKVISKAAHPMISFSEYNFKNINSEKITYGNYGIGFTKDWALKNNIGPVLYVGQSSVAAKGMKDLLIARRKTQSDKLPGKVRLAIMEVKTFIKNERGFNSNQNLSDFNFKAENEWRYIPRKSEIDNYFISQNQRTYERNKAKHNKMLEKYPLKFERDDIKVIFVSNQTEKNELISKYDINDELVKIANWENK